MNKPDWSEHFIGKTISNMYYEKDGDYYVVEFEGGGETTIRFMADIVRNSHEENN